MLSRKGRSMRNRLSGSVPRHCLIALLAFLALPFAHCLSPLICSAINLDNDTKLAGNGEVNGLPEVADCEGDDCPRQYASRDLDF